jgi:(p)ppGpp synthase/HD superfamily hydrolase
MMPSDKEFLELASYVNTLAKRLDIKEIRDEAESQALRTLIKTEVKSMQKDVAISTASTDDMRSSTAQTIENLREELVERYVPISRFSALEKIFWAVVLSVLIGLVAGGLTMLTSRGGA